MNKASVTVQNGILGTKVACDEPLPDVDLVELVRTAEILMDGSGGTSLDVELPIHEATSGGLHVETIPDDGTLNVTGLSVGQSKVIPVDSSGLYTMFGTLLGEWFANFLADDTPEGKEQHRVYDEDGEATVESTTSLSVVTGGVPTRIGDTFSFLSINKDYKFIGDAHAVGQWIITEVNQGGADALKGKVTTTLHSQFPGDTDFWIAAVSRSLADKHQFSLGLGRLTLIYYRAARMFFKWFAGIDPPPFYIAQPWMRPTVTTLLAFHAKLGYLKNVTVPGLAGWTDE